MNKKWIIGLLAVIGIGAILFAGSRLAQERAAAQEPAAGETVTAFIGDLSASATASGQVQPQREATLSVTTPGRVDNINVREGDVVAAGDVLMQLDTTSLALNVANAEQNLRLKESNLAALSKPASELDIASAEAALASAEASLADLISGPTPEQLAAYEAGLASSEASLSSAYANLAATQGSVKDSQILAAEAALAAAQLQQQSAQEANADEPNEQTHQAMLQANQAVADAQANLNALRQGPNLGAAQGSVAAASARLDSSQANFNIQVGEASAAQIASAEAQIAQAEASLNSLLEGPSAQDLLIAEAEVEQAQINLANAQEALAKATVAAPFAAIVTAVNYSEGEIASGPVIELVDANSLEVILEVDEVDIGTLSIGQPAIITMETWPDSAIDSEITSISPVAVTDPTSSLVLYEVHLSLGDSGLPIRVGMTANANLITAEVADVLLVPNQAINADRATGTFTVNLLTGEEEAEEIPVTVGLRDNRYTEITNGLQEGDELLITNGAPLADIFGPPDN